jgi:hypothetical protein
MEPSKPILGITDRTRGSSEDKTYLTPNGQTRGEADLKPSLPMGLSPGFRETHPWPEDDRRRVDGP